MRINIGRLFLVHVPVIFFPRTRESIQCTHIGVWVNTKVNILNPRCKFNISYTCTLYLFVHGCHTQLGYLLPPTHCLLSTFPHLHFDGRLSLFTRCLPGHVSIRVNLSILFKQQLILPLFHHLQDILGPIIVRSLLSSDPWMM